MTNSKNVFRDLINRISIDEEADEIRSLGFLIMEHLFGVTSSEIMAEKPLKNFSVGFLDEVINRINREEPVQYILGEAEFYGRRFKVNPSVLIPRPETEELVRLIVNRFSQHSNPVSMLDVGTGSGCIAVTLSLELKETKVTATDISEAALTTARLNAQQLNANVLFACHDILNEEISYKNLDVVVSNPPYVTLEEKRTMKKNVTAHEPHTALFVPDKDPLIFYKAIADRSTRALKPYGMVAVEINERLGREVANIFESRHYKDISILTDLFGKNRMVTAVYAET